MAKSIKTSDSKLSKKDAIKIILSDTKSYQKSLNYAINYCKYAMSLDESSHEFDVQVLYILSNISYWRHPQAKEVRRILKETK